MLRLVVIRGLDRCPRLVEEPLPAALVLGMEIHEHSHLNEMRCSAVTAVDLALELGKQLCEVAASGANLLWRHLIIYPTATTTAAMYLQLSSMLCYHVLEGARLCRPWWAHERLLKAAELLQPVPVRITGSTTRRHREVAPGCRRRSCGVAPPSRKCRIKRIFRYTYRR